MSKKPNLAIFTTTKGGGTDTFIQAHINRLDANVKAFYGYPLPIHPFDGKIEVRKIPIWKKLLPVFLYNRIAKRVDNEQILEQHLLVSKTNIVLAEYGHIGALVLPVCKKLGIPLIVHFHGHDAFRNSILSEYADSYKKLFSYASYIICVSLHMKKQLAKLGASEDKLILIPYGPNEAFFNNRPNYTQTHFLSAGRFVEKKGPYLTILAFRKVLQKFPNARLTMVGDGPLLPICKNIVDSLGIQNVDFKGKMSHNDLVKVFEMASCYVQHSITASDGDSEGTPVAVLEAGASALPVIATNHAGIPDVVIDGETGFLVEEGDVNGMAAKMVEIIEMNLMEQMGVNGRNRIKNDFTILKHLQKINELIFSAAR